MCWPFAYLLVSTSHAQGASRSTFTGAPSTRNSTRSIVVELVTSAAQLPALSLSRPETLWFGVGFTNATVGGAGGGGGGAGVSAGGAAAVSIVHARDAGVGSTLPAES